MSPQRRVKIVIKRCGTPSFRGQAHAWPSPEVLYSMCKMLKLHKPIKLTNTNGIKEVKKTLQEIFKEMPITDVAYIVALKDVAWDLDLVASTLRKRLNEKVSISELKL